MKKLLLFICVLLTGISGAWADGLKVSTTESASAEYQYKIFCRNASTYYLGNTTNATNSGADYGLFAFFADNSGDYTNGYYIYSIFEGKWVTYTAAESYSEGKNKISLVADKPSVPWNIAADNTDSKYYDIRPFQTDKTVANMSWNWHAGPSANTSNTMGFYSYTDGNSGWGIVLAGGSGSPVADRKVVALYNAPKDGQLYPLYKSGNDVKISNSTETAPQYFVLKQNGLDPYGEALYRIMKAECDNNYLTYQSFGSSESNYMFVNTASWFIANDQRYTYGTTSGYSPAEAPSYYNMFNKTGNDSYSSMVAECADNKINRYTGAHDALPCPYDNPGTGKWNARWKITELAGYTAWQVVMSGATSGTVTYSGSALISGGTATQSNNGIFVLNATPSASDFTVSLVDDYLTDPSVTIDSDRKLIKVAYTEYASIRSTIVNFLANTPETIGYPTSAARATLQAAIDAFDASSKVTSDLVTLNTAYTTFQSTTDLNLPELGKIYTIQNYIKSNSLTTYLKNEGGTLTIDADASATALNNLWVVRKSGNTYVLQSAADLTKYIVYTSFTLAASGSTWTFSQGTEWPYISMFNSTLGDANGRFVACNGSNQFGTAGGGGYYGSSKTQASGWSTDFKFVESEDYALYKVKIIYPSGSAPTVTYDENVYSNGSDFVAPTTLTTGDLTVSTISGYTPSVTIDGDIIYVYYAMAVAAPYADTWDFDTAPWSLLTDAPAAIDNPSRTYRYNTKRINIATTYNSSVEVVFAYTTGSYRIDVAGVDLIDPSTGNVVKGDYHDGFSGSNQSNKEYAIRDVAPGDYILRYISYDQSTSSAGNISVRVVPGQGFYRLKNVATDKYLTATATGAWDSSARGVYANGSSTDASTVIRLFDKDSNGTLYMYNQGYGFGWTATNQGGGVGWITATPDKYVHWFPGNADGQVAFAICYGNGTGGYASYLTKGIYTVDTNDNAVIAGADYTDNKAQWVLEAATNVEIPLTSANDNTGANHTYATLCVPFNITDLTGADSKVVKAYAPTKSGDYVVTGSGATTVTEGTPVILIGAEGATSVTATIGSNYATAPATTNVLTGTFLGTSIDTRAATGTNYVLGFDKDNDNRIGFYHVDNGSFPLKANRAYLKLDASGGVAHVKGFVINFDDLMDGIGNLTPEHSPNGEGNLEGERSIYNLAGQRISKLQRGVNIVNGKKVIVK